MNNLELIIEGCNNEIIVTSETSHINLKIEFSDNVVKNTALLIKKVSPIKIMYNCDYELKLEIETYLKQMY